MSDDAVAMTFLEVRKHIDALRLVYPDRTDEMIALALFHKAETLSGREAHLLGLVATVLHFASKHGDGRALVSVDVKEPG